MRVILSNNSKSDVHYLAGRYLDKIGHLYSPGGQRGPYKWLPYALDNGRFAAWDKKQPWDEPAFFKLLDWAAASLIAPQWVVVPDVVADREQTLKEWERWSPTITSYGWPLAFAVQDGMTIKDVPNQADVIFLGGSTAWKWATVEYWGEQGRRLHVARVNTWGKLWKAADAGAESCDGTGWFRGDPQQLEGLHRFLAEQAGERPRHFQQRLEMDAA